MRTTPRFTAFFTSPEALGGYSGLVGTVKFDQSYFCHRSYCLNFYAGRVSNHILIIAIAGGAPCGSVAGILL